jgi:hypothetical protein
VAAERGKIAAIHPFADGPWIFSRADLDGSAANEIAQRAERSANYSTGPHPDQQTLLPSMTLTDECCDAGLYNPVRRHSTLDVRLSQPGLVRKAGRITPSSTKLEQVHHEAQS